MVDNQSSGARMGNATESTLILLSEIVAPTHDMTVEKIVVLIVSEKLILMERFRMNP